MQQSQPSFVGAAGCKSSSCHGGAGEKRSQYITWSQRDFHTRGYAILLDARSARISESLGIPEPQSSGRCTVCHSPFQSMPQTRLADTARPDEGVSCENCHGAASEWLRGHTRADWTYATRVSAGMHDLRSLYVRANACVACHQNLDADLLKAGHPTLVFELDSQSTNEPKHWREDDSWNGARAWLVGQAVALRESAWRSRTDSNPAADTQETAVALAWLLQKVTLTEPLLPKVVEPTSSDLAPLQTEADDLARRSTNWSPTSDSMVSLLRTLADTGPEFTVANERTVDKLFYRARRLVLALDSLINSLNANRSVPLKLDQELSAMRIDIQRHYDFDVAKFAEHLRALRAKL
jgi:Cytochrome c554 and c-prime